ncbi:REP-associated tyrosine transposase [Bacillus sp. SJS]|uniref:REP-associated tyrosine transposase n=1 Tax=Bacillus sp. SJS TaxID=1423321 RepID=UPI0009EE74D6|nr:transposase [Bacillus sp. SJS]
MSRKPREWKPNTTYHVYSRGNRRENIFFYKHDREKYLQLLQTVRETHPFKLHAYCLMSNHIHLLIETEIQPLGSIMRNLHSRYALYINKRHKLEGHLFQNRFGATEIMSDQQFREVSRYIHMNPVKSGIVHNPSEYVWSSYECYIRSTPDTLITKTKLQSMFIQPFEKNYQKFVETSKQPTAN